MLKLYRHGTTHKASDIACEIRLFSEGEAVDAIADGWVGSVEELFNARQETAEEHAPQSSEKAEAEAPRKKRPRSSRAEVLAIRQRAQDAGISNWESVPVDRLRKALANA